MAAVISQETGDVQQPAARYSAEMQTECAVVNIDSLLAYWNTWEDALENCDTWPSPSPCFLSESKTNILEEYVRSRSMQMSWLQT